MMRKTAANTVANLTPHVSRPPNPAWSDSGRVVGGVSSQTGRKTAANTWANESGGMRGWPHHVQIQANRAAMLASLMKARDPWAHY